MDKAEEDYAEWSKKVRADAATHCSLIWKNEGRGGCRPKRKAPNPSFNPRIIYQKGSYA